MNAKVLLLSCLVAIAAARPDRPAPAGYGYEAPAPSYSAPAPAYHEPVHEEGMPFQFAYAVLDGYSGNDFDHNSNSDGKVTTGQYRVVLPDGRTQVVTYTADHYNGYQAEVTYEGEAQYPEHNAYSAPAPAYKAPEPTYEAPAPTYG